MTHNNKVMSNIFNGAAALVSIGWGIGIFYYESGPAVHFLLEIAIGLLVLKVILE